ncbi:MAG: hypothetical protein R3C26_01610 [Calditrichia bacterium]
MKIPGTAPFLSGSATARSLRSACRTGQFDMPLVYNGQEAGMDKRLDFFEKDPIEWREHHYFEIYKILLNLNLEKQSAVERQSRRNICPDCR